MLHLNLRPLLRVALLSVLFGAVPPAHMLVALATSQHVSIAEHTDAAALNHDGLIESRSAPIGVDQRMSATSGSAILLFVPQPAGVVAASGPQSLLQQSSIPERPALVYRNDFEQSITRNYAQQPVSSTWSSSGGVSQQTTPLGNRHFLASSPDGFSNDTATLALSGLPSHSQVTLDFDLFIIRTWDGSYAGGPGPDRWKLNVASGPTLLDTTFADFGAVSPWYQAYPDAYPAGNHLPGTGAVEHNTLGFT